MMRNCLLKTILFLGSAFFLSCGDTKKEEEEWVPDFTSIKDIEYVEVKRRFSNGLSFDSSGFQLEPHWMLSFKSNDTIAAWSTDHLAWYNFPILHDHGAVFNMVHDFFRVKSIHRDSIVLQRLEVKNREIQHGYLSDVNMTFYSRDYIFNKLKSSPLTLQKPTSKDTLFIKNLTEGIDPETGKNYVFAARDIVQFKPINSNIKVLNIQKEEIGRRKLSSSYMFPRFNIEIDNAHKDFIYLFNAIVHKNGKIEVTSTVGAMSGQEEIRKKLVQGLVDVYVNNYIRIIPGSTLGFYHPSKVEILLEGRK